MLVFAASTAAACAALAAAKPSLPAPVSCFGRLLPAALPPAGGPPAQPSPDACWQCSSDRGEGGQRALQSQRDQGWLCVTQEIVDKDGEKVKDAPGRATF